MKLFQTIQKNLPLLGYNRYNNDNRYHPFNIRRTIATGIYVFGIVSIFIFALHSTNSPAEYMDSIYVLAVLSSIFASYMSTIFKVAPIFDFFDNCEKFCNESKYDCIQIYLIVPKYILLHLSQKNQH